MASSVRIVCGPVEYTALLLLVDEPSLFPPVGFRLSRFYRAEFRFAKARDFTSLFVQRILLLVRGTASFVRLKIYQLCFSLQLSALSISGFVTLVMT